MTREPWKITREMFLSVEETEALSAHIARQVTAAGEAERDSALVDQVIIETLLYSGLRNTEFCRLTLGDVQLTKDSVPAALYVTWRRMIDTPGGNAEGPERPARLTGAPARSTGRPARPTGQSARFTGASARLTGRPARFTRASG